MKKNSEKIVGFTILFLVIIGALLAFLGVYQCPLRLLLGIPCPGCGMTRAYIALFKLDFKKAFELHPLFIVPIAVAVYMLFRRKMKKLHKYEFKMTVAVLSLFIVTWIIRLLMQN